MNELIDTATIRDLADRLRRAEPGSDPEELSGISATRLASLSLKQRVDVVAAALVRALPGGYPSLANAARAMLVDESFRGWSIWPLGEAIVTLALADRTSGKLDDALGLLGELTGRLTAEFPVRRLIQADPERAMRAAVAWAESSDEHVRRLASEGTRPFLPWAVRVPALIEDPRITLPVLDRLYRDPSGYVRRSVGNHLNDLSRIDPGVVVTTAGRWLAAQDANTNAVVRRGLRTLVKKADPAALTLLGYRSADLRVSDITLDSPEIPFPGELGFSASVSNSDGRPVDVVADYVIHFLKGDGSRTQKVFKLGTAHLDVGQSFRFSKRHAFRPMTTRRHYPGEHAIEIQINGTRHGYRPFQLLAPR